MLSKPPPTTVLLDVIKYYTQVKRTDLARAVPFHRAPEVGASLTSSLHCDQIIQ